MMRKMLMMSLAVVLTTVAMGADVAPKTAPKIAPPDMAWFEAARFGMFIHWGAYSQRGIEASWPLYAGDPKRADYEALATTFNPTKFDPVAIAKLAKRAGMKYVILTSKHHDGFSMFDTKLSDYSIMHSPYGKNIAKMLADAVRAEGLKFGFYFSLADWHNPDYMTAPMQGNPGPGMLPQQLDPARWDRFVDFLHGQMRELCTQYGKLSVICHQFLNASDNCLNTCPTSSAGYFAFRISARASRMRAVSSPVSRLKNPNRFAMCTR